MAPPDSLFGVIPTWIGVYVLSLLAFAAAGFILYRRVFRLVLLGKDANRYDRPIRRLFGEGMLSSDVVERIAFPPRPIQGL